MIVFSKGILMPFNKPQKPNYSIFMLIAFIFFYKYISLIMHTGIQNHIDSVYILTAWNDQILFLPLQICKGSLLSLIDIKLFIIFIKTHYINPQKFTFSNCLRTQWITIFKSTRKRWLGGGLVALAENLGSDHNHL